MDSCVLFQEYLWKDILVSYFNVADLILLRFSTKRFGFLKTYIDPIALQFPHRNNYEKLKTIAQKAPLTIRVDTHWNWASLLSFFGYYYALEKINSLIIEVLFTENDSDLQKRKGPPFQTRDNDVFMAGVVASFEDDMDLRRTLTANACKNMEDSFYSLFKSSITHNLKWNLFYSPIDLINYASKYSTKHHVFRKTLVLLLQFRYFNECKQLLQKYTGDKKRLSSGIRKLFKKRHHDLYNIWYVFLFFEEMRKSGYIVGRYIGNSAFRFYILNSQLYHQFYNLDDYTFLNEQVNCERFIYLDEMDFYNYYKNSHSDDIGIFQHFNSALTTWKSFKLNDDLVSLFI